MRRSDFWRVFRWGIPVLGAAGAVLFLFWRRETAPRNFPPAASAARYVRVMTANINNIEPNAGKHSWSRRRGVLLAILHKYRPGIIAMQAATPAQTAWLAVRLRGYAHFPAHAALHGNILSALAGALAFWNQIFFQNRFQLVAGAYGLVRPRHLQRNPTENAYYSLAVLRDRRRVLPTVIVIDTHLRHGNENAALCAAKLQVILRHWWKRYPDARAILLGDMNHPRNDAPVYSALLGRRYLHGRRGPLFDTFNYRRRPRGRLWGTWQNYVGRPVVRWPTDLIFVSRGWKFTPARIIRDHSPAGVYPSDHFFVLTTLRPAPVP